MKNIINLLIVLSGVILYSCEKSLDLYPLDTVTEAVFFKNAEDYKLFATQYYTSLKDFHYNEDQTDLCKPSGTNSISNGSYLPGTSSGTWNNSYGLIRNTNYLIQKVAEAPDEIKDEVAVYDAEARFFRAYAYFRLLKSFGGVPIIPVTLDITDEDYLYGPRNTREEVADFILKDLDDAISVLPKQSELAQSDNGRITQGAALAFKARVALFEGTWQKYHNNNSQKANGYLSQAIDASSAVISSNEYELFDHRTELGDESYRYLFTLAKEQSNPANLTKSDNKEFILSRLHDKELAGFDWGRLLGGWSQSPTKKLIDLYLCKDGLPIEISPEFQGYSLVTDEYENRDPRMTATHMVPFQRYWSYAQGAWLRDWANPEEAGFIYEVAFGGRTQTGYSPVKFLCEIEGPLGMDYPVIRLAEVYLIYAEAIYEKDGAISDEDLNKSINKLRDRVGMPHLTNGFVAANNLNMQFEIRRERTIELVYEDFRFDDLRRWKTAEVEMPKALKGVKWTGTQYETDPRWSDVSYPLDENGFIILEASTNRKFEQKHYLFPLPTRQILLNPALEQNPGW